MPTSLVFAVSESALYAYVNMKKRLLKTIKIVGLLLAVLCAVLIIIIL